MVKFENRPGTITAADVVSFEKRNGISLPADYATFLARHNGGFPTPANFKFHGREDGSELNSFFGIKSGDIDDLDKVQEVYKGRLPKAFLGIADDSGGNLICICLAGKDRGKIYFWDHEMEADESQGISPETAGNTTLIANSFDEFLNGIFEFQLSQ